MLKFVGSIEHKPPGREPAPRKSGAFWPILVFGLLSFQVGMGALAMTLATGDPSFAIEPGYYQKSLDWDETQARRRAEQSLGWTIEIAVAADEIAPGERGVRFSLADQSGAPILGATLTGSAFHHARSADRFEIRPIEIGDGAYECRLPIQRAGKWEFRVEARRGDESTSCTRVVDLIATEAR